MLAKMRAMYKTSLGKLFNSVPGGVASKRSKEVAVCDGNFFDVIFCIRLMLNPPKLR